MVFVGSFLPKAWVAVILIDDCTVPEVGDSVLFFVTTRTDYRKCSRTGKVWPASEV